MPTGETFKAKAHCPQGHPYSGGNLYIHNGARYCRTCRSQRSKKYNEQPEAKEAKRLREANRCPEQRRNNHLQRNYGITLADEQALLKQQNFRCAVCRTETKLVVDHCHTTGNVRGLLCDACNRALGCVRDDPVRLQALTLYLGS